MAIFNLSAAPSLRQSLVPTKNALSGSTIQMRDASIASRVGVRGKGAEAFLVAQGIKVPSAPNQSVDLENGTCVLRLSNSEFWIMDLAGANHEFIAQLELMCDTYPDVYRLYCQHSHSAFYINGASIRKMFSKVCGVDLSEANFHQHMIAQTSIARVNGILLCQTQGDEEFFVLLCDVASSEYLWEALKDAALEFS